MRAGVGGMSNMARDKIMLTPARHCRKPGGCPVPRDFNNAQIQLTGSLELMTAG